MSRREILTLTVVGFVVFMLFGFLGYKIASKDDNQPGTPVERNTGIHIDTSDDFGVHVRKVLVDGFYTCVVASSSNGIAIDCLERGE
jgi:hypothetical protein